MRHMMLAPAEPCGNLAMCGGRKIQLLHPCSRISQHQVAQPSVGMAAPFHGNQRRRRCGGGATCMAEAKAQASPFPRRQILDEQTSQKYLSGRIQQVAQHFPSTLGVDDFVARVEMALYAHGFDGNNTIACCNLCRDEITVTLKSKLDAVFGSSFNTNGLGGVLTCGVTGIGAGLSHAPVAAGTGKERYVFLSFPHIAIDEDGTVGNVCRPGQPGASAACGALKAALGEVQGKGIAALTSEPGVHEPADPEYSILKQRLARRLQHEKVAEDAVGKLDLVEMTKVAERTITDDLEHLIGEAVDSSKADYAVITGVQIHNWAKEFDGESPNLELVAPASAYVIIGGKKTELNLQSIPSVTPRQISSLTAARGGRKQPTAEATEGDICDSAGKTTVVKAMDPPHGSDTAKHRRALREQAANYQRLMRLEGVDTQKASGWPAWQSNLQAQYPYKAPNDNSVVLDAADEKRLKEDGFVGWPWGHSTL